MPVRTLNCPAAVMGPAAAPVALSPAAAAVVAERLADPEGPPANLAPVLALFQIVASPEVAAPLVASVDETPCCLKRPCLWIMAGALLLIFSGTGRKR